MRASVRVGTGFLGPTKATVWLLCTRRAQVLRSLVLDKDDPLTPNWDAFRRTQDKLPDSLYNQKWFNLLELKIHILHKIIKVQYTIKRDKNDILFFFFTVK